MIPILLHDNDQVNPHLENRSLNPKFLNSASVNCSYSNNRVDGTARKFAIQLRIVIYTCCRCEVHSPPSLIFFSSVFVGCVLAQSVLWIAVDDSRVLPCELAFTHDVVILVEGLVLNPLLDHLARALRIASLRSKGLTEMLQHPV